jgi:hypothetical protein
MAAERAHSSIGHVGPSRILNSSPEAGLNTETELQPIQQKVLSFFQDCKPLSPTDSLRSVHLRGLGLLQGSPSTETEELTAHSVNVMLAIQPPNPGEPYMDILAMIRQKELNEGISEILQLVISDKDKSKITAFSPKIDHRIKLSPAIFGGIIQLDEDQCYYVNHKGFFYYHTNMETPLRIGIEDFSRGINDYINRKIVQRQSAEATYFKAVINS